MNPELLEALRESIVIADRLLTMMDLGREEMPRCVNGEILKAYLESTDKAIAKVKGIKKTLVDLHTLQTLGM